MMINTANFAHNLTIEVNVILFVLRTIQMIVAECTFTPPASLTAKHNYLTRVFIADNAVSDHPQNPFQFG